MLYTEEVLQELADSNYKLGQSVGLHEWCHVCDDEFSEPRYTIGQVNDFVKCDVCGEKLMPCSLCKNQMTNCNPKCSVDNSFFILDISII